MVVEVASFINPDFSMVESNLSLNVDIPIVLKCFFSRYLDSVMKDLVPGLLTLWIKIVMCWFVIKLCIESTSPWLSSFLPSLCSC